MPPLGLGSQPKVYGPDRSLLTYNSRKKMMFELISQRYERASTLITSNLPFEEWTETIETERLTGALLDRLTHKVNILEMNGESYRLAHSRANQASKQNQKSKS